MPSIKINRILQVILAACLIIILRVWHLGIIQRDEKLIEAQKPQSRTLLIRADRGTIYDRFQIPLALNKICYNAAIYYGQISQIPTVKWEENSAGERIKTFPRKDYIQNLSLLLGKILNLNPSRIEDLIYSKASLFPHAPFLLKAGISEKEHYQLKALERDWVGLHAEIASERFYPLGKTACHLIGTMGAIHQKKYREIAEETALLQEAVQLYMEGSEWTLPEGHKSFESVYQRLHELKEKAYRFNDLIGKSGIEGQFEEELRGYFGKKSFEVDQKGHFIRELPGSKSVAPGRQLALSISSELQNYAEKLLAQSELEREGRSIAVDPLDGARKPQKQPWIKGGAIVVLDPNNGEILAWASHPRFNPNDFIPSANPLVHKDKQKQISKWLESDRYISSLWDGKDFLTREIYNKNFIEEPALLTWETYLDLILPKESPIKDFFRQSDDIASAIRIQEDFEALLYFSESLSPLSLLEEIFSSSPQISFCSDALGAKKRIETALSCIPDHKDKLFTIDLCRLIVDSTRFSDALLAQIGSCKLSKYRSLCQTFQKISQEIQNECRQKFHDEEFLLWREENQKKFILEKRKWEKANKTYARPYLDYLDRKEKELFDTYWSEKKFSLIAPLIRENRDLQEAAKHLSEPLKEEFLRTFRSFQELDRSLLGVYPRLKIRGQKKEATEKDLAASFYPSGGFGFSRSYTFQTSAPLGSVFKLVTAYEGLRQGANLNLIDKIDKDPHTKNGIVAYSLNNIPYYRLYKGGRLPRSASAHIGKIDIEGALEQSSNPYFSILAGDFLKNPDDLALAARQFGFGERTGVELSGESTGNIPNDLTTNRTGLYSFAIGQHTLLSTPIQAAIMLATLANGGKVLKPKILLSSSGLSPDRKPLSAFSPNNTFAKKELEALGIHYPLFTKMEPRTPFSSPLEEPTIIKKTIPLPSSIRSSILHGMDLVLWGAKGRARAPLIRSLRASPSLLKKFFELKHQMIGKSGTAEILFNPNINPSSKAQMYKHTWFGAISFTPESVGKLNYHQPELVIVVFSRYGEAGKDGAPIAARLVHKWREIQEKHKLYTHVTQNNKAELCPEPYQKTSVLWTPN